MENLLFFWLVVAVLFLIMEMGAPGLFFFLSFFFGALICALATFFTQSLVVQSIIFLIGTAISFLLLHFFVKTRFVKGHGEPSNMYALQGKQAVVLKAIAKYRAGKVKVFGDVWTARTYGDEVLQEGERVEIVQVKGAHLIVKKFKKIKT